ncbi:MAG: carboxypeptidase-like regulatory domain-containing protein [Candidatus Cyclobacteriaceae bacterium M3_2C_046]
MLSKLLLSSLILSIFYLAYLLILKRETFFPLNRIFLLSGLIASFTIPWMNLNVLTNGAMSLPETADIAMFHFIPRQMEVSHPATSFSWYYGLYGLGISFLMTRFVWLIYQIFHLVGQSTTQKSGSHTICLMEQKDAPFSFFKFIFIPRELAKQSPELDQILLHEKIHSKQWHSFDRILLELAIIIQWINPLVWLYKKELILCHEYLADQGVTRKFNKTAYQTLLVDQMQRIEHSSVINQFNSSIKKRILMMNQIRSRKCNQAKYLILFPLFMLAFLACNLVERDVFEQELNLVNQDGSYMVKGKILDLETNKPLPGVNIIIKGTSIGTVSDLSGNYHIMIPKDRNELIFAFVDKKTLQTETDPVTNEMLVLLANKSSDQESIVGMASKVILENQNEMPAIDIRDADKIYKFKSPSKNPMFIIDGKVVEKSDFKNLDPNHIKKIEVLNQAHVRDLPKYDPNEKDGVIIITTK